jgi:SecD/SecF fusion protein
VWFRFGSFRYGLAAIIALLHDVTIAMGLIAASTYLYDIPWARDYLLITPYRINLGLIAALLTIIGYSLNDTIIVFDRIRENRGKLANATVGVINDAINQTISRTVLTSGTTLLAVMMLYVFGGEGIREFAFALLIGVGVGTYSSVAVAAPILVLWKTKRGQTGGLVSESN